MSFQPLVSRWYLAMPSTIEAESLRRVVVGGDRVVHEGHLHRRRTSGAARGGTAVGAPRGARDDRRRRARAAAGLRPRAPRARAPSRRPAAPGTATKCTRSGPRSGRARAAAARRSAPVQTGSEARSPVPVSGAWSPRHGERHPRGSSGPPRRRARTSRRPRDRLGAAHAEQVEAPRRAQHPARGALEVAGADGEPKPRARVPARARRHGANGRPAASRGRRRPRATRARRRVIVVATHRRASATAAVRRGQRVHDLLPGMDLRTSRPERSPGLRAAGQTATARLGSRRRAGALGAQPALAVGAHAVDDRDQRAALLGQRVLDARRHLGVASGARRSPPPRARAGAARACAG